MMLGMATGENSSVCVQDFGIDNRTAADGLAVGRASGFVGGLMRPFMSGCYTLQDERMYTLLAQLADAEDLYLEPSALAGMYGPVLTQPGQLLGAYTEAALPAGTLANATHLVWATGGNMVPGKKCSATTQKARRWHRNKQSRLSCQTAQKAAFIILFQEQRALRKLIPAGPLRSRESARRSGRHRYLPENPAACPSASADRDRSGGWWSWAPWPDRRTGSRSPSPPEP